MSDRESLLATRFAALATTDAGDWLDVRRRARRSRVRKTALLLAAATAAILVAAPAVGFPRVVPALPRVVTGWFDAELAPQDTQVEFQRLIGGADDPPELSPGAIPNTVRKVTTVEYQGKEHVLWVAPTARGGFCYLWTDAFGGCFAERELPRVPSRPGELNPLPLGAVWGRYVSVQHVGGALLIAETDRLTLEYVDGSETEIPVVWVSAPIDAGFYLYFIPAEHREPGREAAALVARDHEGNVLARELSPTGAGWTGTNP